MHNPTQARRLPGILASALLCLLLLAGCSGPAHTPSPEDSSSSALSGSSPAGVAVTDLADVPDYSGEDYIELNEGEPSFTAEDMAALDGTEAYGELDCLGRATGVFAKVCGRTQPEDGAVRDTDMPDPTGFVQARYLGIGLDHLYDPPTS